MSPVAHTESAEEASFPVWIEPFGLQPSFGFKETGSVDVAERASERR